MNEMLAPVRAEHISLRRRGPGRTALQQRLADAETSEAEQNGSALVLKCDHDNLL
jgi:hypothetical protein